ncbi:SIT4 phosphatase-associated protein-domain-containing protein [Melampsora americana]|nr:SIT4 phosphatase-associated protein-domain-containing protein [Melampsora americana]
MAFWRFGFHSQSAIDTILSSSAANNNGHPIGGCSTPSSSNPAILLDKLLDEDDLLQEIKAQHPKLIEFLATKEVVVRILGYISGVIFEDEDADRLEEEGRSAINHLTIQPSSPLDSNFTASSTGGHHTNTMGAAIFNSFRSRGVCDKFSASLLDALDSEGRTPEDRAKNERRKVRFPYLCSEIIASDIWNVTSQIFADAPHHAILTGFWDDVLNQPPSVTAHKSIQIGHWARTNIVLFNSKPNEMIRFVLSYPGLIPKLLSHFNSSPVVDVLLKIIQCEAIHEGIIDWLIDSTDFVELIINFLHPSRPVELHIAVADFLKNVVGFCTTKATPPQSPADQSSKPSNTHSPILPHQSSPSNSPIDSFNALHPSSAYTLNGSGVAEDGKSITTRLMRELVSTSVVSKLLSFGLDAEMPEEESLITKESITSSLVNSLSILIDLIRRNNSDFSEAQILIHLRKNGTETSQSDQANISSPSPIRNLDAKTSPSPAPAIVALMDLLDCISDRLPDLQRLIRTPTSSVRPIRTTVGTIVPLTLERFRIIELYAELLHCSNMSMVNRSKSSGPVYDQNGHLISGLEDLIAVVCSAQRTPPETTADESTCPSPELTGMEKKNETEATVESALDGDQGRDNTLSDKNSVKEASTDVTINASLPGNSTGPSNDDQTPSGMRLKRRFIEHKVLDTCLDLFFDFPWNNFLHNVVYDIIQQILNGNFSGPGGEASLELAKSLFDSSRIVERILEGISINQTYGLMSNNVRLGNMAHLILIADEISKALELQSETFIDISRRIESNSEWQQFLDTAVKEARLNSHTPLGGSVPQPGLGQPGPSSDKSLVIDGETFPNSGGSEGQRGSKAGWSMKSPTLADPTTLQDQETKDDDDEKGFETEEPSHRDQDDDDPWSTGRPSNTRTSSSGSGGSVISNPTPFGFDDRFDAPSRSFPTRFGAGTEEVRKPLLVMDRHTSSCYARSLFSMSTTCPF